MKQTHLLLGILSLMAVPAFGQSLSDANFENANVYYYDSGTTYENYKAVSALNNSGETSWNSNSVGVSIAHESLSEEYGTPFGSQFVKFDAADSTMCVFQDIKNLEAGKTYEVSFYTTMNTTWHTYDSDVQTTGKASIGDTSYLTFTETQKRGSYSDSYWNKQTFTFTASDVSETLYLCQTGHSNPNEATGSHLLIDNVSVRAVPEASSSALLGLAGISLLLRRRR